MKTEPPYVINHGRPYYSKESRENEIIPDNRPYYPSRVFESGTDQIPTKCSCWFHHTRPKIYDITKSTNCYTRPSPPCITTTTEIIQRFTGCCNRPKTWETTAESLITSTTTSAVTNSRSTTTIITARTTPSTTELTTLNSTERTEHTTLTTVPSSSSSLSTKCCDRPKTWETTTLKEITIFNDPETKSTSGTPLTSLLDTSYEVSSTTKRTTTTPRLSTSEGTTSIETTKSTTLMPTTTTEHTTYEMPSSSSSYSTKCCDRPVTWETTTAKEITVYVSELDVTETKTESTTTEPSPDSSIETSSENTKLPYKPPSTEGTNFLETTTKFSKPIEVTKYENSDTLTTNEVLSSSSSFYTKCCDRPKTWETTRVEEKTAFTELIEPSTVLTTKEYSTLPSTTIHSVPSSTPLRTTKHTKLTTIADTSSQSSTTRQPSSLTTTEASSNIIVSYITQCCDRPKMWETTTIKDKADSSESVSTTKTSATSLQSTNSLTTSTQLEISTSKHTTTTKPPTSTTPTTTTVTTTTTTPTTIKTSNELVTTATVSNPSSMNFTECCDRPKTWETTNSVLKTEFSDFKTVSTKFITPPVTVPSTTKFHITTNTLRTPLTTTKRTLATTTSPQYNTTITSTVYVTTPLKTTERTEHPTLTTLEVPSSSTSYFTQCCDRPITWEIISPTWKTYTFTPTTVQESTTTPWTPTISFSTEESTAVSSALSSTYSESSTVSNKEPSSETSKQESTTATINESTTDITSSPSINQSTTTSTSYSKNITPFPESTTKISESTKTQSTIHYDSSNERPDFTTSKSNEHTDSDKKFLPEHRTLRSTIRSVSLLTLSSSALKEYTGSSWWYPTYCDNVKCQRPTTWLTTSRRTRRRN